MTPRPKLKLVTTSSWHILARHSPAEWIGTVEAVNAEGAIDEAVKLFDVEDPQTLIAVRGR